MGTLTKVYKGDTWRFPITTENVPDGTTARMTIKYSSQDDDAQAITSVTTNIASNAGEFVVPYTTTENVDAPAMYYWDAQVLISGEVYTLDFGTLPVALDVRRVAP
jgi:hypothetical protein